MCAAMGILSYLAYGNLVQDIVLYNLPQDSNLASVVALLYMLNIVGSITMTIQPIYGLFEKGQKDKREDAELQVGPTAALERPSVGGLSSSTDNTTEVVGDGLSI